MISHFINGLLVILLVAAVYTDVRYRRIPNWQTVPAFGLGIALNAVQGGPSGLLISLGGGLLGMAILLVPYFFGYVGAGDVKLQMAVGAIVGWPLIFWAAWYGAFAGGALAVLVVIKRRSLLQFLRYLLYLLTNVVWRFALMYLPSSLGFKLASFEAKKPEALRMKLPYGVAIALGVLLASFVQL